MLPYQRPTEKLEKLLEQLFEDDNSTPEDVKVLKRPKPFMPTDGNCCTYSYLGYS